VAYTRRQHQDLATFDGTLPGIGSQFTATGKAINQNVVVVTLTGHMVVFGPLIIANSKRQTISSQGVLLQTPPNNYRGDESHTSVVQRPIGGLAQGILFPRV